MPAGDPHTCDALNFVGESCGFGEYYSAVAGECRCLGNLEFDDNSGGFFRRAEG